MIRVTLKGRSDEVRLLEETDFIAEITEHQRKNFVSAPDGPVSIAVLDDEGRVRWQAYYRHYALLAEAARELLAEQKSEVER